MRSSSPDHDLLSGLDQVSRDPRILSVTEVTRAVRTVLESTIGQIWVEGEISNYRRQASGHQYFTLKDENSQLTCVLFARPGLWRRDIPLSDGMCVQVRGNLTVYEARGQYQLNVQTVQASGAGLLQAKFEALKRRLEAEGLFDPAGKQPLPRFPTRIGLVTSPSGAALQDMLNILKRRAPWVQVLINPVRVQGTGAALEIAAAVAEFNQCADLGLPCVDLIVVARGGGSMEDLWEFNEEVVARAIAASALPVVSAVGHEIDFTISDFVADLRAPTPSAAAELIVPDAGEMKRRIRAQAEQLARCTVSRMSREKDRLRGLTRTGLFREPQNRLNEAAQRLDIAADALKRATREQLSSAGKRITDALGSLRQHRPDHQIAIRKSEVARLLAFIKSLSATEITRRKQHMQRVCDLLRLLSPESTLDRGYTITTTREGELVDSAERLPSDGLFVTRFKDGKVQSEIRTEGREEA